MEDEKMLDITLQRQQQFNLLISFPGPVALRTTWSVRGGFGEAQQSLERSLDDIKKNLYRKAHFRDGRGSPPSTFDV